MKLPVIALIVAIASALFTATNVFFSVRTYRRVKPKVVVKVQARRLDTSDVEDPKYWFSLRLYNRGTTPIGVERVRVLGVHHPIHKARTGLWESNEEWEEPLVVRPLDGLPYVAGVYAKHIRGEDNPHYVRFTFYLTDGRRVRSKKIRRFPGIDPVEPFWG